ncbi:MAG: hypothetical protein C0616_05740 [Desulfuromonas sp.]|nr:MAG: hypothetical protein C0616_05740 [Desulfuromonas sp.]
MSMDARDKTSHRLSHELTAHSVASALSEIQELVRSKNDVAIDLTDVEQIDTCGLQLLLVACQVVREEGRKFQLTGDISQNIQSFVKESGFDDQFDDMIDADCSRAVI